MTLARVAPGVPTGGQFAATSHPEADVSLTADAGPTVSAVVVGRAVERLIGGALNHARHELAPDDNQDAYHDGLAQAGLRTAAELLTRGDAETTTRVYEAMREAMDRTMSDPTHPNTAENRAAIAAAAANLGYPATAATHDQLGEVVDRHIEFVTLAHAETAPGLETSKKTPAQWAQIGLRNGYAHGVDQLLNPTHENLGYDASDRLLTAVGTDEITDVTELRQIARGGLLRTDLGDWYDPYDDQDY